MHFNFICIEGNIGIGKTTLVKNLSEHFKTETLLEEFDDNPWLPLFYKNPTETALILENSFLTDRSKQLLRVKSGVKLFSDYCLDKCLLFTKVNLQPKEFKQYQKLHETVSKNITRPDLVICIHSKTEHLLENIKRRNRSYERAIDPAYLDKLNKSYKKYFSAERPYYILNIFTKKLNDKQYEKIFKEVVSFLQQKPQHKISTIKV
ncbi:MAG: deoxynucleoside kinase [Bacteroidia bacterium]